MAIGMVKKANRVKSLKTGETGGPTTQRERSDNSIRE